MAYRFFAFMLILLGPLFLSSRFLLRYDLYICKYGHHTSQEKNQPGNVANPTRGQLNRGNIFCLSSFAHENLGSRDGFGSAAPRQPYPS